MHLASLLHEMYKYYLKAKQRLLYAFDRYMTARKYVRTTTLPHTVINLQMIDDTIYQQQLLYRDIADSVIRVLLSFCALNTVVRLVRTWNIAYLDVRDVSAQGCCSRHGSRILTMQA